MTLQFNATKTGDSTTLGPSTTGSLVSAVNRDTGVITLASV
jgi:tRNA U55 pseudouridine synthase TruB